MKLRKVLSGERSNNETTSTYISSDGDLHDGGVRSGFSRTAATSHHATTIRRRDNDRDGRIRDPRRSFFHNYRALSRLTRMWP